MMYGPDPYDLQVIDPQYYPLPVADYGYGYPPPPGYSDEMTWVDLVSQGIGAARDVARVAVGGYPPQDIYAPIYAPQYPAQTDPRQTPTPGEQSQAIAQAQAQRSGVGFQISTPTLMLVVGGVLLFMLGQKRGR